MSADHHRRPFNDTQAVTWTTAAVANLENGQYYPEYPYCTAGKDLPRLALSDDLRDRLSQSWIPRWLAPAASWPEWAEQQSWQLRTVTNQQSFFWKWCISNLDFWLCIIGLAVTAYVNSCLIIFMCFLIESELMIFKTRARIAPQQCLQAHLGFTGNPLCYGFDL